MKPSVRDPISLLPRPERQTEPLPDTVPSHPAGPRKAEHVAATPPSVSICDLSEEASCLKDSPISSNVITLSSNVTIKRIRRKSQAGGRFDPETLGAGLRQIGWDWRMRLVAAEPRLATLRTLAGGPADG